MTWPVAARASSSSITERGAAASTPASSWEPGRGISWWTTNCSCIFCIRAVLGAHDYADYKALFVSDGKVDACVELACLAYAHRKFHDLHQANQSSMALEALRRIALLYSTEAEGNDLSIEERKQLWAEKSLPHLQTFHTWLVATRGCVADGSAAARAMNYTIKR